ncbi:MAG: Gfo/Idh/MocA family oxidoreductase [Planctomycetaceae bacterium]|nr:Gfo/Idh/MocA family oxidoreductase [Planctomycetaceae bacterium]
MDHLKIGLVGVGFIGKQHIEAIRRIPGAEVVAVADSNPDAARAVAEQFYIPRWYGDHHELLDDPAVAVVHNCTPSSSHYQVNLDALDKKKHIYCEKPLTLTATKARELVVAARRAGVANGVNLNYRHNVMVKEMRERARTTMGKPYFAFGEYLQDWLMYDTDYDWRMNPAVGGESRAVADIGSHCFDTLQYALGKRIASVNADIINVFPVRKRCETTGETFSGAAGRVLEEIPVPSEDAASIILRFEDGTPGLVHISQVTAGKKNGLAVTLSGAEYSLEWHQEQADRLHVGHRNGGNEEIYADAKLLTPFARPFATLPGGHAVAWHDALRNAIGVFYQAIRSESYKTGETDYADFAAGWQMMCLVEACLESGRSRRWVDIPVETA